MSCGCYAVTTKQLDVALVARKGEVTQEAMLGTPLTRRQAVGRFRAAAGRVGGRENAGSKCVDRRGGVFCSFLIECWNDVVPRESNVPTARTSWYPACSDIRQPECCQYELPAWQRDPDGRRFQRHVVVRQLEVR